MMHNKSKAIQDLYPDELAHCYGCGKNNLDGYQLKTYLVGDETIAHFLPDEKFTALPGSVYGGLVASLLDCHGTGSAAAFVCVQENINLNEVETIPVRCVTASLKVDFKAPTPMGVELKLRGKLQSIEGRKIWVDMTLSADDTICELKLRGKLQSIEGRKIWVDMTLSADDTICATGEILAIKIKD